MATKAGQYHGTLASGNSVRNPILQGYVFASGIHDIEHSNILSYKYPQYYATALLERLGAYQPVARDVFSWNIMDRTREGAVITNDLSAASGATVSAVTNQVYSSPDLGYFVVGDHVRTEKGFIAEVTAVAESGGFQQLTLKKVGESSPAWVAGDLAQNEVIGHITNSFAEASSAPNGRLYLPSEEYNVTQILRRSFNISGTELTNKTLLGDGSSWYWTVEDIEMKEFARDRELAIVFGKRRSDTTNKVTNGLWQYVWDYGVKNGYASASGIAESDLRTQIKQMLIQGCSKDITVLAGADAMSDIQVALRDYAIGGALNYGSFGANMAGLDFQSYKFMGINLHFAYYELFDDVAVVPTPSQTVTTSITNFSKTALFLDLGMDSGGRSLINLKYKSHDGIDRKFIHAHEVGMVNAYGAQGGAVSSGDDKFTVHLLSEIGLEFRLPNRSGILRATS